MAERDAELTGTALPVRRSWLPSRRRPGPPRPPSRRRGGRVLTGLAATVPLVLTASIAGLLPVQLMRVDSGSMTPTLDAGDLLVVDRTGPDVSRMDVVTAESPDDGTLLVKRVVGLGGDTVGIEDGVLVVDGAAVCEPDIDPDLIDGSFFGPVTVPEGHVFLLGDSRDGSIDSRIFGTVPLTAVIGEVRGRVFPSPSTLEPERC